MLSLVPDLEATFLRYERTGDGRTFWHAVERIEDAQGVEFLCPLCFAAHGGSVGTHRIVCWSRSRGVPDLATPGPGRWSLLGTGLHDLSLGADAPSKQHSVQLSAACRWHGFVRAGQAG